MRRQTSWIVVLVTGMVGLGIGSAVTFVLSRPQAPDQRARADPAAPPQEPSRNGKDTPQPRLEPVEATLRDVLCAAGAGTPLVYQARDIRPAYYAVTETNDYDPETSNSLAGWHSGFLAEGGRLVIVPFGTGPDRFVHLGELTSAPANGGGSRLGVSRANSTRIDFAQGLRVGGVGPAIWSADEPLRGRPGQALTLLQIAAVDDRSGVASSRELDVLNNRSGAFRPLPPVRKGQNGQARLTLRIMFMDPSWTHESKEVRDFLDPRKALGHPRGARD
jgi:hypothetical protein